jgi:hypothetical protein
MLKLIARNPKMRKRPISIVLLVFAFLAIDSTALAQRGRPRTNVRTRTQLAAIDKVQEALQLDDEQKDLAKKLHASIRNKSRAMFQEARQQGERSFAEMYEEIGTLNAEADEKLSAKLTEAQKTRLTEVFVQVNNAEALLDESVSTTLEITDEQRTALFEATNVNLEASREANRGARDLSDDARREKRQAVQKENNERLLAVLTEEQQAKLKEMAGEDLNLDQSVFRRQGNGQNRRRQNDSSE